MDNINIKKVSKMYENLTYFDQYGSSLLLFILISILLFIFYSYCFVMTNVEPIKNDWPNQRCNPYNIPFAGLINKPHDMTATEFTKLNFDYCVQNVVSGMTGISVQPLTFVTSMLNNVFSAIGNSINSIRQMINKIRRQIQSISQEIMGRIMNITIPLQQIIIGMKDMLSKVQGTLTAGLFTLLGSYFTLQSMMGAVVEFLIIILIAIVVIVAVFWIVPFTWGMAIANTAIFIAISIPLAIIITFMTTVLKIQPGLRIPRIKCFDKYTRILMNNGSKKKIIDINVGDILENGNKVTGIIKVVTVGSEMYELNNVLVSDSHIVKYKDSYIKVIDHPHSIKVNNYTEPYLYCLNTSSKEIIINNTCFVDWDDLYEENIEVLKNNSPIKIDKSEDIHQYLDGGFESNTNIKLLDGSIKKIKDIEIGDILENDIYVYGLVKIDGLELNEQCEYNIQENIIRGGANLIYHFEKKIGSTIYLDKNNKSNKNNKKINSETNKEKILYHLLTDRKILYINNIKFNDYNSCIDIFLD